MLTRRIVLGLVAALFALTILGEAPGAAAGPAAVSAEEMGLTFEDTCTPDTFRPNEWVVLVCDIRLANGGQDPLGGISVRIGSPRGVTPDYYWMWYTINGEFVPVEGSALSFGRAIGILQPGQTVISRVVGLVRMPEEGTYESDLTVSVGRQDVQMLAMPLTAVAGAPAPPAGLLVTKRLASRQADSYGVASATYFTTVTNQGSSPVTELKVTDRYSDPAVLVGADPAPASEKAAFELASWDLASFGKESLAPGESLVLRTTYGPAQGSDCGYVTSGVVVEAVVGGQRQFYGAHPDPDQWAMVGDCQGENRPGGGDGGVSVGDGQGGGPMSAPGTGEGPSPSGGNAWWMTAVLAAGGASLVGAALALRRRARLGPRIHR